MSRHGRRRDILYEAGAGNLHVRFDERCGNGGPSDGQNKAPNRSYEADNRSGFITEPTTSHLYANFSSPWDRSAKRNLYPFTDLSLPLITTLNDARLMDSSSAAALASIAPAEAAPALRVSGLGAPLLQLAHPVGPRALDVVPLPLAM